MGSARPGRAVRLACRVHGETLRFTVQQAGAVDKDSFPHHFVYGPTDQPVLWLITCYGPFDYETGYPQNYLVQAVLADRS